MDDSEPLRTLLDLAHHLGLTSTKSARRALLKAMENDPGLQVTKRGRTILFTPEQFARTVKALAWSPPRPVRAARSVSVARVGRPARSAQSAQVTVRELLRRSRKKRP